MVNFNYQGISKRQAYGASLGISSIIFLWSIQIFWGKVSVPVYFFSSVIFIHFTRFTATDVRRMLIALISLLALLLIQKLQGISLTTPLRTVFAIPALSFIFACVYRWLRIVMQTGPYPIFKIFRIFLIGQILLQFCQLGAWAVDFYSTSYQHYLLNFPRVSGFFLEPSHVSFSLSPFIYMCICHQKLAIQWLGRHGLFSLLLIFVLCPSATLFGSVAIALFARQIQTSKSYLALVTSIVIVFLGYSFIVVMIFYIPELSQRFGGFATLLSDTQNIDTKVNLSVLMFIKGWQMAFGGVQQWFFGVGLLNYQALNEFSSISFLSDQMMEFNAMGGTSVATKLIGEFGYIGLFIVIFSFVAFLIKIRNDRHKNIVEAFFLFGLIISYIRGTSYFDGVPIIALAILYKDICKYSIRIIYPAKYRYQTWQLLKNKNSEL